MQKIKVRKDVAEQVISKLKTPENSIKTAKNDVFNTNFAEKLQKQAVKSENKQVTIKLEPNYGQTADGQIYDLTDPTEKFYYDLKRKFDEVEQKDEFEKGFGKYISKKYINGRWVYKYHQDRNTARSKINYCISQPLKCTKQDALAKGEQFIKDWQQDWRNNRNKSKCPVLGGNTVVVVAIDENGKEGISLQHFGYKGSGKKFKRPDSVIKERAELLPFAKEMLESKDKSIVNEVRTNGNITEYEILGKAKINGKTEKICVIVSKIKNEALTYLSIIKKAISEDTAFITDVFLMKSSKNVPFWAEQEGGITLPQPSTNIPQINNLSSKKVIKSLTFTDKLFNLWVRRLSPELKKEMKKYVDESSKVYSLFSGFKNVYEIKGYPKGLDLENNILMELTDTYFIVACGGDWQDEKLVKFSIGDDDKLKAEVVDKCNKEDKRVLNKKLAYIISPSEITKSLTYSGHKLQGRTRLYGMDISIENKKGSYRSGVDKDGHKWRTYMNYDYGYIRGTVGTDKDHLDCYVGPDKEAQKVYIIHQNDPVTHKYDEDKCMLCFSSADAAKKAYMKQYDRPGFFGSMTTMTIDEFKSFIFSKKGKMIHKSFDIQITDITENNKQQKLEQFSKALNAIADNRQFVIKHIPADNSTRYENLTVRLMDFDRSKIEKAVHKVALSLDADVLASSKGESFVYESQKEITEKFYKKVTDSARAVYNFVISYFDLPDIRIISKAGELKHKGKILYNPETGLPIKESEWKKFIVELEKFLNRNYSGVGEKIVLSAESLGIILDRLSKTNSLEAIRKMPLSTLKAKRYDVDWISDSIQNMKDKFGDVISRERQGRIQIAMDSAAQRVTRVKDDMRNNIQQIIIDGIRDKQSKSVVAQNLFDKCASLNRDMQRIADSEVQMAANSAYCKEEVYNSKPDEKVYFKRFEMMDDNTCKQCKKLNGTIVLWSDVPLPDEHIRDPYAKYAIWEGKNEGSCPIGIVHPYCRGSWIRYYPDIE